MNSNDILYLTVVMLAATLNFGFVYGALGDPLLHHWWQLVTALLVNGSASTMMLRHADDTSSLQIAAGLAALLQLLIATALWLVAALRVNPDQVANTSIAVASLAAGALLSNLVSLTVLVVDSMWKTRRMRS